MLLTLIIILMLIWSAVVWSLYSNFLVFYTNFSETENYNKAYYASISAIERAELVLRQHQPWYEWSWWWKGLEPWHYSDQKPTTDFSYLSNDDNRKSTLYWNIKSRTDRIPSVWNWDVDKMLSALDSSNYNKMDYENSEIVLLHYDNSTDNPYESPSSSEIYNSKINKITTNIRLPWYISWDFGSLDTDNSLTPWWNRNDPIINWQLKWNYTDYPFTIYPKQDWLDANKSIITENDINYNHHIVFQDYYRNPIVENTNNRNTINIITNDADEAGIAGGLWPIIHWWVYYSGVQLKFSLLNLLQSTKSWMIYPFLEYNIVFEPSYSEVIVPDKYYKIEAIWNFWDYQINTIMFKPTITESILRTFTTIL